MSKPIMLSIREVNMRGMESILVGLENVAESFLFVVGATYIYGGSNNKRGSAPKTNKSLSQVRSDRTASPVASNYQLGVDIQNRPAFSSKRKYLFKKSLSLSQPMLKAPVNKGSRVFPAGAKGRRRFTSLSQNWVWNVCETSKARKGAGKPCK